MTARRRAARRRRHRAWSSSSAARIAAGSSGGADDPRPGLPDQLGRGSVGRDGGEDRPPDRDVLEDLPREDALAPAACVGDQQEERLRVPLQRERLGARRIREKLEAVAEPQPRGPVAVGLAEVAQEAGDDVELGVVQRLQERPRVAAAEEAPRVRDPEAVGRPALEAGDVVEVGAVRDRHHRSASGRAPSSPR